MEKEPTNNELSHYLKDIKDNVLEIKTQVQKTNGRVNALENWRWFITGGVAVICTLIVPLLIKMLNS